MEATKVVFGFKALLRNGKKMETTIMGHIVTTKRIHSIQEPYESLFLF